MKLNLPGRILGFSCPPVLIFALLLQLIGFSAKSQNNNTLTNTNLPDYAVTVSSGFSGITPPSISLLNNVISASKTDSAVISGGALGGSAMITVTYAQNYNENTFAGFEIANGPALLDLSLLSAITIEVLDAGGNVLLSKKGDATLANLNVLTSNGHRVVGFISSVPFRSVRIVCNAGLVSLGSLSVFGAVIQKFAPGPNLTSCNSIVNPVNPTHPVFINASRSAGGSLLSVNGTVENAQNIIDDNPGNSAKLSYVAGVASNKVSVAVKNQLEEYPVGTFAGFDIKPTNPLLNLNVLTGITITTYNGNSKKETITGSSLLIGASSSLLGGGEGRYQVGFVTNQPFDEIVLSLNDGLLGASLGSTEVFGVVLQKFCAGTLQCNNTFWLNQPDFPVIINSAKTGVSGVANVGTVSKVSDVISSEKQDYGIINLPVGALSSASISVKDVASSKYPIGTIAGFAVQDMSNLAELALLSGIRISTYLDGQPSESKSGIDLLNLSVITTIIGPGTGVYNLGFRTSKAFDEIQITYENTAAVLKKLHVYGAFADTRYVNNGILNCGYESNPDIAITNLNVPVSGNVASNDKAPAGVQYAFNGNPVSAPTGATPAFTLNQNGSYDFVTNVAGVYIYAISICTPGLTETCPVENLTITVLDPKNVNGPVVNADIAVVTAGQQIIIPALYNDKPGTNGAPLNPSTITIISNPSEGTAAINQTTGEIIYNAPAGYSGSQKLVYRVCDLNNNCGSAEQKIHIVPIGGTAMSSASPDYFAADQNKKITGNVSANDFNTASAPMQVTFLDTPTSTQGTLQSNSDGSFSFQPNPSFKGPLQLRYQTAMDSIPNVTSVETLNLLLTDGVSDLTPSISLINANFGVNTSKNFVVRIFELENFPTNKGLVEFSILVPLGYAIEFDSNMSVVNLPEAPGTAVQNSQFSLISNQLAGRKLTFKMKSEYEISAGGQIAVGFKLTRNTSSNSLSSPVITVNIIDDQGRQYDIKSENNIYTRIVNSL